MSAMEEHSTGRLRNPPHSSSSWASFIVAVLIGMVCGAPGGLLLGSLEVATLTCLESNDSLSQPFPQFTSILPIALHNCIVILSSAVGIIAGRLSFSEVKRVKGEGATGEALAIGGAVSLMVVTITGAALGAILFRDTWIWYIVCVVWLAVFLIGTCSFELLQIFSLIDRYPLYQYCVIILLWTVFAHCVLLVVSGFHVFVNSKTVTVIILSLLCHCVQVVILVIQENLTGEIVSVTIICFITETLLAVIKPVTSIVTVIAAFNPILTSQLVMVRIGMFLFVSWQTDDAITICVAAVLSGGVTVLSVILGALPVLGAAPSVGALMGVAGAVGVSLAAAGAVVEHFGWGGRLGVAVGAAVVGFAASCAHSGLSGVSIGLYAATNSFVYMIMNQVYRCLI